MLDVTGEGSQWERSDILFIFPGPSPGRAPLYSSCYYIQQSVQCAAGEPAGSALTESQRGGRERRGKCEWISALT